MNILVTGGSGFIGSHLSKSLLEQNHSVTIIDNLVTGNKNNLKDFSTTNQLTFIQEDITTFNFEGLPAFDYIFHLASPASPIQYWKYPIETLRTNAEGTYNVLEHIRKTGKGVFVLASTSEVYGDPEVHPQVETYWGNVNSFGARSCYDEAKRYAEAMTYSYAKKFNIDVRVARIFNTYGPQMEKEDGRVVSNFINQAIRNTPITIYGDGSQTRSLCYVSDLVKGLEKLAFTPDISMEVINLGNPNEKTVLEIAELIKKLTESKSEITFVPIGEDDPKKRKPDISKAKKILKWQPAVELLDGLQYTIEYFRTLL